MKLSLVASWALAAALCAHAAGASTTYPKELLDYYGIDALPAPKDGCTLCHKEEEGGAMTITTQYGRALFGTFNAKGSNIPSLRAALEENDSAGWDSDQDGISDADELRAGMDPNTFDGMGEPPESIPDIPLPQTGCALAAPASGYDGMSAFAVALAGLLLARRRSRSISNRSTPVTGLRVVQLAEARILLSASGAR